MKYLISILLLIPVISVAKCLPEEKDSLSECRYTKEGDTWCKEHRINKPYSYDAKCLSKTNKVGNNIEKNDKNKGSSIANLLTTLKKFDNIPKNKCNDKNIDKSSRALACLKFSYISKDKEEIKKYKDISCQLGNKDACREISDPLYTDLINARLTVSNFILTNKSSEPEIKLAIEAHCKLFIAGEDYRKYTIYDLMKIKFTRFFGFIPNNMSDESIKLSCQTPDINDIPQGNMNR